MKMRRRRRRDRRRDRSGEYYRERGGTLACGINAVYAVPVGLAGLGRRILERDIGIGAVQKLVRDLDPLPSTPQSC